MIRETVVVAYCLMAAFLVGGCTTATGGTHIRGVHSGGSRLTVNSTAKPIDNSAKSSASVSRLTTYRFVHDPTMIREGKQYYVFSTGDPNGKIGNGNIQIRTSLNLTHWKYDGTVFKNMPHWIRKAYPKIINLWAPDILYYNGTYHLYYVASSFGSNHSVIALATNKTLNPDSPNYHWIDDGPVLESVKADDWNAIDPNLTVDQTGQPWLSFGSFWSGIKIVRLNRATGMTSSQQPRIYSLVKRAKQPDAVEASNIIFHNGYYYLFTSFGLCCRGVNSTYRIMVGRSKSIRGPYVDQSGVPMLHGGGTLVLGNQGNMIGPGGQSVYKDGRTYFLVYHYYDAGDFGAAKLQIRRLYWNASGWIQVGPPLVQS